VLEKLAHGLIAVRIRTKATAAGGVKKMHAVHEADENTTLVLHEDKAEARQSATLANVWGGKGLRGDLGAQLVDVEEMVQSHKATVKDYEAAMGSKQALTCPQEQQYNFSIRRTPPWPLPTASRP